MKESIKHWLLKRAKSLRKTSRQGSGRSEQELLQDILARIEKLETQLSLVEKHHIRGFWYAQDRIDKFSLSSSRIKCLVCHHVDERDGYETLVSNCIFDGGRLERYRCPQCDCIFGAQKFLDLDEEMTRLDYQLLYSRYRESESSRVEERTFRSLSPTKDGVYINWGAGAWNNTTQRLRVEGYNVWSYEPNTPADAPFIAKSVAEIPISLAGIFSNNVIEHFKDPIEQFREFHSLLATGAKMAHSSPCYEYNYPYTRFHTVFLLGRSPKILADRTGFRIVSRVDEGEYINVVFEKT